MQPHTSAGRVPTDRGYRFFVDNFERQPGLAARAAPGRLRLLHPVRVGAPGARGPAPRDQPAPRPGEHAHRGGRRPAPRRRGDRAQRAAGRPPAVAGARAGDPVERQRREEHPPRRRRHRRRHHRHRRRRCSTRSSPASRWVALPELRAGRRSRGRHPRPRGARRAARPAPSRTSSSRSTWAAPAASPPSRRRSPTTTSAARLLELLERQVEVVSLVHDLLDQGPTVRIGSENPIDELRDCSIVVAPYTRRRRGRRHGRRARAHPHGLPPGARRGRGHLAATRRRPLVNRPLLKDAVAWLTTTRSSASPATRPTTRSSARTARWRASTTPTATPTTPTPRRGSRRSASPTRRCAIRSGAVATTCSVKTAPRAGGAGGPAAPARRSASATSSTRSSAATRSATAAARPARRARPTPRRSCTSTSRRPRSAPPPPSRSACPVACERCEGSGCEPGTHPARCDVCGGAGEVREVRRSILGQIVTAAPCVACSATGSRIPSPCQRVPRRRPGAGVAVDRRRGARRASTTASACGSRAAVPPRRAAACPATSTSPCASRPTRASNARATTSSTCARIAFTQATLGTHLDIDTLEGLEELIVPPGTQPGHLFRLKGRGVPALRGRGRGDLLVRVDVEVPDPALGRGGRAGALARRAARRGGRARRRTRACSPGSSPRSSSAPRADAHGRPPAPAGTRRRDRARLRRAPRRPHHRRRRRRPPPAARRGACARARSSPRPTGTDAGACYASSARRPGRVELAGAHATSRTNRTLLPRAHGRVLAHQGREARARRAEAHRARASTASCSWRRRGRSCAGTTPRPRPAFDRLRARRARSGDAVAPRPRAGGRRPGRAAPSWRRIAGLVRRRGSTACPRPTLPAPAGRRVGGGGRARGRVRRRRARGVRRRAPARGRPLRPARGDRGDCGRRRVGRHGAALSIRRPEIDRREW